MEIRLNQSCPLDLNSTLRCGQAFRWEKCGDWWYGVVGENVVKIRQVADRLEFQNVDEQFIRRYFRLDDNLPKILSQINRDEHIAMAIHEFKGLRILRQEPWECLVSYICATYKSIAAIKHMLSEVSKRFGEQTCFEGRSFYVFPTAEKLANATCNALSKCGLGYRAKYVSETAKRIHEDSFALEELKRMTYEDAKKQLLCFSGVGMKVADCVLLFSLNKLEAFPVDIWIKRAIIRHYAKRFPSKLVNKISKTRTLSTSEYQELNLFGREYFGIYAGYAQEYLYHYGRMQQNS